MVVPTKWKTTRPTDLCLATRAGLHHRIRGRSHSSAYLRRDRRTPLPTPSRTGERPAEQYAPRRRTHYPSHAGHQRRGRGAILPRRCSPPACRRPLPHPAILAQLALYIAVTAAMGIPLLLVASALIGGIAALEARRADSLISATTLHLVWSIGMAFLLPVVMR